MKYSWLSAEELTHFSNWIHLGRSYMKHPFKRWKKHQERRPEAKSPWNDKKWRFCPDGLPCFLNRSTNPTQEHQNRTRAMFRRSLVVRDWGQTRWILREKFAIIPPFNLYEQQQWKPQGANILCEGNLGIVSRVWEQYRLLTLLLVVLQNLTVKLCCWRYHIPEIRKMEISSCC